MRKEQSIGIDRRRQVIFLFAGLLRVQEGQFGEGEKLVSAGTLIGDGPMQLGQRSFGIRLEALR